MFGTTVSGSSKVSEILVWDSDAPKTKTRRKFPGCQRRNFSCSGWWREQYLGRQFFSPRVTNFFSFHWTFVEVGEWMVAYEPIDPQSLKVGEIFKVSRNHPQKAHEQKNAQGGSFDFIFARNQSNVHNLSIGKGNDPVPQMSVYGWSGGTSVIPLVLCNHCVLATFQLNDGSQILLKMVVQV